VAAGINNSFRINGHKPPACAAPPDAVEKQIFWAPMVSEEAEGLIESGNGFRIACFI